MAPGTPEKYDSIDAAKTEGEKLKSETDSILATKAKTKRDLDLLKGKIELHAKKADKNIAEATPGEAAKAVEVKKTKDELDGLKAKIEDKKKEVNNSVEEKAGVILGPIASATKFLGDKVMPTINDTGEVLNSYVLKPLKSMFAGIGNTVKTPLIFIFDKLGWKSAADYLRKGTEAAPDIKAFNDRFKALKTSAATAGIDMAELKIDGLSKEEAGKLTDKVATLEKTVSDLEKLGVGAPFQKFFEKLTVAPGADGKKAATIDQLQAVATPLLAEAQKNADPEVVKAKKLESDNKERFGKLKTEAGVFKIMITDTPDAKKEETKTKLDTLDTTLKNITPPPALKKVWEKIEPAAAAGSPKNVTFDQLLEAASKAI